MATEQPIQKFTDLPFREQLAVVNLFTKTYGVSAVDMKWFWDVDATQSDKWIIRDALENACKEAHGEWCLYCGSQNLEADGVAYTSNGCQDDIEITAFLCVDCDKVQP